MKSAGIVSIAAAVTAVTAFATLATGLDRLALWQVVRACVADYKLTGAPFPCLEVDLSAGEERGDVVLRPPLLHDTILAPTRKIVGIEDPFLQSPEAPNYFDAAWRARSFLKGPDGQGARARCGRPHRQLRCCQGSGSAPHSPGLPGSGRKARACGGRARRSDRRMDPDRRRYPAYGVLGDPHSGDRPPGKLPVSARRRSSPRRGREPAGLDDHGRRRSRRRRRPIPDPRVLWRRSGRVVPGRRRKPARSEMPGRSAPCRLTGPYFPQNTASTESLRLAAIAPALSGAFGSGVSSPPPRKPPMAAASTSG